MDIRTRTSLTVHGRKYSNVQTVLYNKLPKINFSLHKTLKLNFTKLFDYLYTPNNNYGNLKVALFSLGFKLYIVFCVFMSTVI